MKKTLRFIIYASFICLFVIFEVIPMLKEVLNKRCDMFNSYLKQNINGVVIRKSPDPKTHSNRIIEIQDLNDTATQILNCDYDVTGFYFDINIDDTLKKKLGENVIFVSNKLTSKIYHLDYKCH